MEKREEELKVEIEAVIGGKDLEEDYPELNNNLLNKLQPLIDACTCKLQGEN